VAIWLCLVGKEASPTSEYAEVCGYVGAPPPPRPLQAHVERRLRFGHRRPGSGRTTTLRTLDLGRCALATASAGDIPCELDPSLPVPVTEDVLAHVVPVLVQVPRTSLARRRSRSRASLGEWVAASGGWEVQACCWLERACMRLERVVMDAVGVAYTALCKG
jgi:hypothetical protein